MSTSWERDGTLRGERDSRKGLQAFLELVKTETRSDGF